VKAGLLVVGAGCGSSGVSGCSCSRLWRNDIGDS
jgi:hypothetical protein